MSTKIGSKIKLIRGKRSLREMERLTGISHVYLMRVEKGVDPRSGKKLKPSPETLRKISEVTGENYVELLLISGYLNEKDLTDYLSIVKAGE